MTTGALPTPPPTPGTVASDARNGRIPNHGSRSAWAFYHHSDGPGVLSDRPMGGLTAGGGEERGSILLCSMHDPCGVQNLQLMAGRSVMPSPPEKLVPRTDGDERPERARVSKRLKSKSKVATQYTLFQRLSLLVRWNICLASAFPHRALN